MWPLPRTGVRGVVSSVRAVRTLAWYLCRDALLVVGRPRVESAEEEEETVMLKTARRWTIARSRRA